MDWSWRGDAIDSGRRTLMARHEDDEVVVVERGSSVGPFLLGLAVGAAAALLLAPMSGRELRGEIRQRTGRLRDLAMEKAEEIEEMMAEGFHRARSEEHTSEL